MQKTRDEERVVLFSSASLFPVRKWEAVTHGGNHRDRPPDAEDRLPEGEENPGIVKGWEDKRDSWCIPDTFTENKNSTSAGPLTSQQLNPASPTPL